ncbi:MAG: phytanoyl-CoA dioxygenase family protein [Chloroflexi bacterium]|nr:phytanoyl-CoA dioxygenase family protein [Chloroflexota bacterium]
MTKAASISDIKTDARRVYREDGFFLCDWPVVSAEVIANAVHGMDEVRAGRYETGVPLHTSKWNPGDDPNLLCKMEMTQRQNLAIRELVSQSSIGEWAAAVTGAGIVQVWWVQLLYKPPSAKPTDGITNVGWHQDRQYWGAWEDDSELLTAWVALSDVTAEAGPMRYVRGSHQWGERDEGDFHGSDHDAQRASYELPEGAEWNEVEAILPPGGIALHGNFTLHASGPNLTDKPRRSFAIHMRTERSRPKQGRRERLTAFIDDEVICPIIYQEEGAVLPR